jgi:hypothetical protein
MILVKRSVLTTWAMTLGAASAYGFHSVAPNFDMDQEIVLAGAVLTEFRFVNPHVYLFLQVPGDQGG